MTGADAVADVRQKIEDTPTEVTDNFTGDGTTTRVQLTAFPINSVTSVKVNGVAQVETTNWSLDYDTGLLTMVTAPPNGQTLEVIYKKVRIRDGVILEAIADGVREMYPEVYIEGDVYILARNQISEYDLTSTTDVPATVSGRTIVVSADQSAARTALLNPLSTIHYGNRLRTGAVETDWQEFLGFIRRGQKFLHVTDGVYGNDLIRLHWTAPPTPPATLGATLDVPDQYAHLPVLYAVGTLLLGKETVRDRMDGYEATQAYNAVAPSTLARTSKDYFAMFYGTLGRRGMRPVRRSIRRGVHRGYA